MTTKRIPPGSVTLIQGDRRYFLVFADFGIFLRSADPVFASHVRWLWLTVSAAITLVCKLVDAELTTVFAEFRDIKSLRWRRDDPEGLEGRRIKRLESDVICFALRLSVRAWDRFPP